MKERLLMFLEYKHMSNHEFEKEVGLTNGYVANISEKAQVEKLERIFSKYPELSREWLMTGTGEMLTETVSDARNVKELISLLRMSIEEIRAQRIQLDKVLSALININK